MKVNFGKVQTRVGSNPEETVVPFGQFKGWAFKDMPLDYISFLAHKFEGNPVICSAAKLYLKQLIDAGEVSVATESTLPSPESFLYYGEDDPFRNQW
jgi:hypothetical protein